MADTLDTRRLRRVDEALTHREARGLRVALIARALYAIPGTVAVPLYAQSSLELYFTTAYGVLLVGLAAYCWRLTGQRKRLAFVGWSFALADAAFLCVTPFVWYEAVGGAEVSRAFTLKNEVALLGIIFVVLNSLALRPVYPALVGATAIGVHAALAVSALGDPSVVTTPSIYEHFMTEKANPAVFYGRMVMVALVTGFVSWLTHSSRNAAREAVRLEEVNLHIRERQTQMVAEGKMVALGNLVAGIAHEVNSPLGAVVSSLGTIERATEKLDEALKEDASTLSENPKLARIPAAVSPALRVARDATGRIEELVQSLKSFARLDEAEEKKADLRAALDDTLSLIEASLRRGVEVQRDYEAVPEIRCRPRELNQVFMTLLRNALYAMKGAGTLTLAVRNLESDVEIAVCDTGGGIPEHKLATLFDIGFATKSGRIGMGLGLPTAQRIVSAHGGSLDVENRPGDGVTFTVRLPKH